MDDPNRIWFAFGLMYAAFALACVMVVVLAIVGP
jgi:hypothetical protein